MYTGYWWSHQTPEYDWGHIGTVNNGYSSLSLNFPAKAAKNIYVKNNVFYLSKYALLGAQAWEKGQTNFMKINLSGNTYVQNTLGILAEWQPKDDCRDLKKYYFNGKSKSYVIDLLGDKTGKVLVP